MYEISSVSRLPAKSFNGDLDLRERTLENPLADGATKSTAATATFLSGHVRAPGAPPPPPPPQQQHTATFIPLLEALSLCRRKCLSWALLVLQVL